MLIFQKVFRSESENKFQRNAMKTNKQNTPNQTITAESSSGDKGFQKYQY